MKEISDLNDIIFEGYIWLSDKTRPEILLDKTFDFSEYKEGNNPFIIEALLYDRANNKSVHIMHTGKYHIHEFDLNNLPEGYVLKNVEYMPHRLTDIEKNIEIKKVYFKQLWLPEKDENCEGWPVLKMKALVFTGFTNPKNLKS